jgi:hypothetical protein
MAAIDCAGLGRISALAAVLLAGLPALAGSATAESVWNRANALERARQQVPAGATITREHCQEIWVGMDNIRYRCSVEWQQPTAPDIDPGEPDPGPATESESSADPAHGSPPGR